MIQVTSSKGVTLIELMVVIAIAAILAVVAAPSFNQYLANTRLRTVQSQLLSDLNFARSEAIKRNTRALICVRNAAGTDCGGTMSWNAGWLVCVDDNGDGACDASTAAIPNPSKVQAPLNGALTLTSAAAVIRFNANGSQGAGGTAALTLSASGAATRTFSIAPSGGISK